MITVTYYSSACVGLRTPDCSILCDPWFTDGIYDGAWYTYPKLQDPVDALGPYDIVYISHIHPDHYDPAFLKPYLARHPGARVVIADFPVNFLSRKMQADGIAHDVISTMNVGDTALTIVPNDPSDPHDVDTALAVDRLGRSVLNMNDNAYNEEQIARLLEACDGTVDIALLGYTGAGPYPQTYIMDGAVQMQKAEEKKQTFFERYLRLDRAINARANIPFAGQYVLSGRLATLNDKRGVADAAEILAIDPKAMVLEPFATIDTETLTASAVRTQPHDPGTRAAYCRSIANAPMDYEAWFDPLPVDAIPFRRLLARAFANAKARSASTSNHALCIHLPDGWAVMTPHEDNGELSFHAEIDSLTPRSEIYVDPKHLFGLLTGVFHWNNAEIGSHYMCRRVPDRYDRDAMRFLTFLHV